MKARKCLMVGLMSGTSADGVDAVLIEVREGRERPRVRLVGHMHQGYRKGLGERIRRAGVEGSVRELCELNAVLGELFSEVVLRLLRVTRRKAEEVMGIGSHGQTFHHLPWGRPGSTLQLGEGSIIAERTGICTVCDFRPRDMAAGGQGAPLVPFADWVLFGDGKRDRLVQNIGGIGNLTFLRAMAGLEEVVAFDTGPGNMIMDACAQRVSGGRLRCDRDGRLAARGQVHEGLLGWMMGHGFLRKAPPKSTGREEFGGNYVEEVWRRARRWRLSKEDLLATVTMFTVECIRLGCERWVYPRAQGGGVGVEVILGGGGAKNPVLREFLRRRLRVERLWTHEDFGVPNEAKEAMAFGLLGYQTLMGRPGNVPSATGAKRSVVLGKVISK